MSEVGKRLLIYRSLLWTLVVRELKARYRGSFLGYFWSLFNPLLLLGVYTFVFNWAFDRAFGLPASATGEAQPA